jgi:hypothetical protein
LIAVSLEEFFGRVLSLERAVAGLFERLAERLKGHPELAALVRGLGEEERDNLEMVGRFRDSLPEGLRAAPSDEAAVRQLERSAGLLEDDPLGRFTDFEEAYQFVHEVENNQLLPLLRLLERECRTERIDCTPIMMIVEHHLARLDAVAAAAGDRARRRAIRL